MTPSSTVDHSRGSKQFGPRARSGRAVLVAGAAVMVGSAISGQAALAATNAPHTNPPVVVDAASRIGVGTILVTPKGATLYRDTADGPNKPTCTGGCASIWPAYLLPGGDTKPVGGKGVTGTLGTVKVAHGRLQVTCNKEPLYTFTGDSGKSVNGNGVGGFAVVKPGASHSAPAPW